MNSKSNEEETNILYSNLGKLITSSLSMDKILEGVMREVQIYFNPVNWSLMRMDRATGELFFVIATDGHLDKLRDIRLKEGEGIAGRVVTSGEAVFVPDTSKESGFSNRIDKYLGFETRSIIGVPIKFRNDIYGVIEIINHRNDLEYTSNEVIVLQAIADFTAIAFANSALYEESVFLSFRDPLTGCFNRRKLNEVLEMIEHSVNGRRSSDAEEHYTIIMIDLNCFKDVNDKCGHKEGDLILKKTAEMLGSVIRREDMLFRTGGDEFLILLKGDGSVHSGWIGQKFDNMSDIKSCADIKVKFAYGFASGSATEIKKVIHEADINMYKSKNSLKGNKSCY